MSPGDDRQRVDPARLPRLGPFRLLESLDQQSLPPWDPSRLGKLKLLLWLVFAARRHIVRGVVWIVVGLGATMTVLTAFFAILEPWNHSLYLWPTLTGSWYGEFTAPGGKQVARLEIDGDGENPSIEGTATTCDERGTVRKFQIRGGPRNWRGSRFGITTSRTDEFDDEGVRLARMDGEWAQNTMRVTATLDTFKQVGGASISSSADPPLAAPVVHFTLRRGGARDFLDACRGLRATR